MKDLSDGEPLEDDDGTGTVGPRGVLIVSSSSARAAELAPHVQDAGFEAWTVAPDEAGFGAARAIPPALVLVDAGAGDPAALRFISRLRGALGSRAPSVIAIVEGEEPCFELAFGRGACDVLSWPVPASLLRVKVARHVRRLIPAVIGGFAIRRILGRGGMGTVYLAERQGELSALKVLEPPSGGHDAESVARFRRECDALRSLCAPGIPRFLEAGRDGDAFFCAMEYVAGETLAKALERGPLTDSEVVRIVAEVGEALEEMHAIGLIHRDVKPHNVIRGRDGRLRLVDFGLARTADDLELTRASEVLGTVAYMAPELLRGERASASVDAFALGMTTFEAALGASPIVGSTFDVASRIARGELPRPSERLAGAAPELVAVVEGLLAVDPDERLTIREARARVRGLPGVERMAG